MTKIKNIKNGDYVLSFNVLTGKYEYKKVLAAVDQGIKEVSQFSLEDGTSITCTPDHKILSEESLYAPINTQTEVCTVHGKVAITSETPLEAKRVFDITVEDNHNFVLANGAIVKNCGAQTPFSSINYGTGTTPEQRLVIKSVLEATDAGMGSGETPIFPVQVFKVLDGTNTKKGDPNYDLFQLACKVSAKRLFPNFVYINSPYNYQFYKKGHPETEVAVMGCRTRVLPNIYDPEHQTPVGRGNIAFTTINLPKIALLSDKDLDIFFNKLDKTLKLCYNNLYDRFKYLSKKHAYNYPFLLSEGVWLDSEKLQPEDTIEEVLKQGTLAIGFCGLAECLVALIGKHHGESEGAQQLGLKIVGRIKSFCDQASQDTGLTWGAFASPAESAAGRFARINRKEFGLIEGVTDRDYISNGNHVPVYYPISAAKKIEIEAPYHELCSAGDICYVECNGDLTKNPQAFENIILYMKDKGICYGSINHPVDRCPVCGYVGIINDICPKCGRKDGEEVTIEHLREIGCNCY